MFHVEKQFLYPICREMLYGLGLKEMARKAGLSPGQVDNILKHGHARNNRAVLFNICAAMLIHLTDVVLTECPEVSDQISNILSGKSIPEDVIDLSSDYKAKYYELFQETTEMVTEKVLRIGRIVREKAFSFFNPDPNSKHYVQTIFFTCLLPTVGFHVLTRTGHINVTDNFWLSLTNVLHTSGHLKYQELVLFYGFFRSIKPKVVFTDLLLEKPGVCVTRLPSFTSARKTGYDKRGWNYVHLDESLEMLIIRHVKSLKNSALPQLESSAAWLLEVSQARSFLRNIVGASRVYAPSRTGDDTDERKGPLDLYDRNRGQLKTVFVLVELMRERSFLSIAHRCSEKLRNVFADPVQELSSTAAQRLILSIPEHGKTSAMLHASAILPDVFGRITEEDVKKHLGNKRLKGTWTTRRKILPPGIYMEREAGANIPDKKRRKRSNPEKLLSERRHTVAKALAALTLAERAAIELDNYIAAKSARERWSTLHETRHLVSPFADAYRTEKGEVRHAQKSQMAHLLQFSTSESFSESATLPAMRNVNNLVTTFIYDFKVLDIFR